MMNDLFDERLLKTLSLINYYHTHSASEQFYIYTEKEFRLSVEHACVFLYILAERFPDHIEILHLYDFVNEEHWLNPPRDPAETRPIAEVKIAKTFPALKREVNELINRRQNGERLEGSQVHFDVAKSQLHINSRIIEIFPDSDEAKVIEILLRKPTGEFTDWSVVVEAMTGNLIATDKQKKAFYDAVQRVNKKIQVALLTDEELFTRKSKMIRRNY